MRVSASTRTHGECKNNLVRIFVDGLTDNDEKVASMYIKKIKDKRAQTITYIRTKRLQGHTLGDSTYPYSPYKVVFLTGGNSPLGRASPLPEGVLPRERSKRKSSVVLERLEFSFC